MEDTTVEAPRGMWPRLLWILVPAAALLVLLAVAVARTGGPPRPGDPAPAFSAPLLEGEGTLALDDLAGRPVVLNFWASWCAPCRDEAPMLKKAHAEFGDEVAFVGVNIRDGKTAALDFLDEYGLEYPDVRDEGGRIARSYGLTGQPETFFISHDGIVVEHLNGPVPSEDVLLRLVGALTRRG
jgi:cytochrome c biogenesis protein CcmG/thiol:disulfide interchange protein DsbE